MEIPREKPITFDIKKEQRFQSKKRKLEALLNLFQEEEKTAVPVKKKKSSGTLQDYKEDYKTLKCELKKYMKKSDADPCFYLTGIGSKSKVKLKYTKNPKTVTPLFVKHVYQLLLRSVIGTMSPYTFDFAKLEHPNNLCKTVVLVFEGLPKNLIIKNHTSLPNVVGIFTHIVEIVSSNLPFPRELSTLHQINHFHIESKDTYTTMFPSKKVVKVEAQEDTTKPSKLHLLLSPIQLVMENYPLPKSVFPYSKSENYTFSRDSYAPVTADSPMFALDCEMCRTVTAANELTRIAVIDEKHEIIYQTLVKPKSKIVDYMTKFSGITKKTLSGVSTRLEDVQQKLRSILPPDAILCGQSLNCDLHALKMIHPYVIDTSIIFNDSGMRAKKDSLKYLSMMHLNESIQDSKSGHHPVEDALAAMKLVQLKLSNTIQFGDACLATNNTSDDEKGVSEMPEANDNKEVCNDKEEVKDAASVAKPIQKMDEGFFALTSKYKKKVRLIGSEETLDLYGSDLPENVQKTVKSSRKKIIKAITNEMDGFDLTISHIDFNSSEESNLFEALDRTVKHVFDCCSEKTMFMVLTSGVDKSNCEDIRSGLLMATVKRLKQSEPIL